MATVARKTPARPKLTAQPKSDIDLKVVRQELTERYKNTLEYLGR